MEMLYSGKASTGSEELQRIAEAVKEAAVARQRLGAYLSSLLMPDHDEANDMFHLGRTVYR